MQNEKTRPRITVVNTNPFLMICKAGSKPQVSGQTYSTDTEVKYCRKHRSLSIHRKVNRPDATQNLAKTKKTLGLFILLAPS